MKEYLDGLLRQIREQWYPKPKPPVFQSKIRFSVRELMDIRADAMDAAFDSVFENGGKFTRRMRLCDKIDAALLERNATDEF